MLTGKVVTTEIEEFGLRNYLNEMEDSVVPSRPVSFPGSRSPACHLSEIQDDIQRQGEVFESKNG